MTIQQSAVPFAPTKLDHKTRARTGKPNPLVSVIIPNFNHAQYLGDAIRSVLDQSYANVEVIVVDDGSTDQSRAVAAQFGDRILYLYQTNRGLSAARNTGIQAARGEYIGLLDADDLYEPHFVSSMLVALQSDPAADGVFCGYQFVDQQNKALPQVEARPVPTEQLYETLLDGNFFVPESILVHRQCYTSAGAFDETLRACEDWDMWLRISRQHKIIGTNLVLTRHRVLAGSMSSDPTRMIQNRMAVLAKHMGPPPEQRTQANIRICRAYGEAYLISAVEYLQFGDQQQAYECLRQGVQLYPALLDQLRTFFELGCGSQPKGERGNFAALDLKRNWQTLNTLLDRLAYEQMVPAEQSPKQMIALAHFALGLISYGAGNFALTRGHLLQALFKAPQLRKNRQLLSTFVKALIGARLVDWLKQKKTAANDTRRISLE